MRLGLTATLWGIWHTDQSAGQVNLSELLPAGQECCQIIHLRDKFEESWQIARRAKQSNLPRQQALITLETPPNKSVLPSHHFYSPSPSAI